MRDGILPTHTAKALRTPGFARGISAANSMRGTPNANSNDGTGHRRATPISAAAVQPRQRTRSGRRVRAAAKTLRLDHSLYCVHGEVIRRESPQVSSRSEPVACRRPHRNQGANKSCCCLPERRGTAGMVFKDRDRLLVCVGASQSACVRAALRSFWRCLACLRSFLALRLLVPFPPTLLLL